MLKTKLVGLEIITTATMNNNAFCVLTSAVWKIQTFVEIFRFHFRDEE